MNSKSYALGDSFRDSFQIEFHVFYWFLIDRFKWVFCWNFLTVLQARFVLLFVGCFIYTHNLSRAFFWDNIQEAIFSPSSVVLYRVTSFGVTSFMISIFSHFSDTTSSIWWLFMNIHADWIVYSLSVDMSSKWRPLHFATSTFFGRKVYPNQQWNINN